MVRRGFFSFVVASLAGIGALAAVGRPAAALWALAGVGPIVAVGLHDVLQTKRSLLRNYPVIGHGRYLFEAIRPEIQQYFVESDTDGAPFDREHRAIVYQRAKGALQTVPFGTKRDVYAVGHEWLVHSLAPRPPREAEPRVRIGGPRCRVPYLASRLNVSAMSYGSLSKQAILALNLGARTGGFWHNTGEGGLSPYHLEHGGDLVWQIGTGYFGCRTPDGRFDANVFAERSHIESVRMIEIKLSQGAKPAHGGILPAAKVSPEIAAIRGVPVGQDVLSPPYHSAFSTPAGLLEFVERLRQLSGGKPVGFKLCVGDRVQFLAICKAMLATGITPDFITVDGAEGGTGAAPMEFANSVGMPLVDGLSFVHNALVGAGLRDDIRLVASGKIVTGFHIARAIALGADVCNSARGMMMALGCIQARRCNDNTCPVGIATSDPRLSKAIDVDKKAERVARFHADTIEALLELVGAAGLESPDEIGPEHVMRRVAHHEVRSFAELYEQLEPGCLRDGAAPGAWRAAWDRARPDRFAAAPRRGALVAA
ncbi:MAG: FMN-binding glutamate synthase family protein [Deltaproteobacteria bacterium]|nr:MAG: FMN-binding glutamate synthase family protein [Deltaproteobacteria bacterium]